MTEDDIQDIERKLRKQAAFYCYNAIPSHKELVDIIEQDNSNREPDTKDVHPVCPL